MNNALVKIDHEEYGLEKVQAEDRIAKIEADKQAKVETQRKEKQEKERAIYETQLKKERDKKSKIEAKLKQKQEEEEQARREVEEKEREAKLAPDKKKLERLAVTIQEIQMPDVTSKEAKNIIENVVGLLNKTSNFIKEKSITI